MKVQQANFINESNKPELFSFLECPDHIELVRYLSTEFSVVEIPGMLNDKPVTVIGDACFFAHREIEHITFHSELKTIGDSAFGMCRQLKELILPDSVTEIGPRAFRDCQCLRKIILPDDLETLNTGLFSFCYLGSSVELHLPKNLRHICANAFYTCTAMLLCLPDSVTDIDIGAFYNGPQIKSDVPADKGWFMPFPYMEVICDKKGRNGTVVDTKDLGNGCQELKVQFSAGQARFFYPSVNGDFSFCDANSQKTMLQWFKELNYKNEVTDLYEAWLSGTI